MYRIITDKAPRAIGPYSQGTSAARFVFVSGQLPVDPDTNEIEAGDISCQTRRCIANVQAVLSELDLTLDDVTKTTVFLTDMDEFEGMNSVYAEHFMKPGPARSCVQVAALPRKVKVMIEAIACR